MTPANAFTGFAVSGDEVSSKTQNSTYNGTRWRGGLTSLVPGQGYTYKSGASEERTLVYTSAKKAAQNNTFSLFLGKDMHQSKPTTANLMKVAGSQAESKMFKKVSMLKK
jgi:hypothetical protein